MFRGDWFKFKNRARHVDAQGDNDITVYGYNGNIYYRIGHGQPKLIGGQTIINNYVQGGASDGRGVVTQMFEVTEENDGQTEFEVTEFVANNHYIPLIDNVIQSRLVVTRSGQVFTYAPGLSKGQVLLIIN